MLVTDHYEVLHWGALASRLEAEPDVEGDRREGWTRFVELGNDMRRSLLAINIGKTRNRIEPFARTTRLADEGRTWLERVAGDSIRFLIRDSVDPISMLKQGGSSTHRTLPAGSVRSSAVAGGAHGSTSSSRRSTTRDGQTTRFQPWGTSPRARPRSRNRESGC